MRQILERALVARRESRRIEFKETFDVTSNQDWCETVKDIIAMANSGGGVILFGVNNKGEASGGDVSAISALDPAVITDRIRKYIDANFAEFELIDLTKDGVAVVALLVQEAHTPIVFSKPGTYPVGDGKQKSAFGQGTLYFRHGAKSEPATTDDISAAIERRVNVLRKSWLSAVKKVVEAPAGASVAVLPAEIRDSDSPDATPVRIVDDPRAQSVRLIDYDKSHPYRQKELLSGLRRRVPSLHVNQFDLLAVRYVFGVDQEQEWSHKSMFGSRQYSERFLNWLVEQVEQDALFFDDARRKYAERT